MKIKRLSAMLMACSFILQVPSFAGDILFEGYFPLAEWNFSRE